MKSPAITRRLELMAAGGEKYWVSDNDGKGMTLAKRDGIDKLGKFDMCAGVCGICHAGRSPHEPAVMVVRYRQSPAVDEYVSQARSLLIRNKKTKNFIRTIGINCGCYAKVHRQIAHIAAGKS